MKDWSTFTRRITVNAPTQAIYNAWAVPWQIKSWFLRVADYVGSDGNSKNPEAAVEVGDTYFWGWHGYGDDINENGTVVEADGNGRFAFTFSQDCLVTVSIKDEKGETVVELTQSRIPDDPDRSIYVDYTYGWTFYLANLKSILEGGIDLRNKNVDINNVVNS